MNDLLVLEKEAIKPEKPTFMVAGFNQWANAGDVSSGIPEYLIEKFNAKKVGHIRKGDFYILQRTKRNDGVPFWREMRICPRGDGV